MSQYVPETGAHIPGLKKIVWHGCITLHYSEVCVRLWSAGVRDRHQQMAVAAESTLYVVTVVNHAFLGRVAIEGAARGQAGGHDPLASILGARDGRHQLGERAWVRRVVVKVDPVRLAF